MPGGGTRSGQVAIASVDDGGLCPSGPSDRTARLAHSGTTRKPTASVVSGIRRIRRRRMGFDPRSLAMLAPCFESQHKPAVPARAPTR